MGRETKLAKREDSLVAWSLGNELSWSHQALGLTSALLGCTNPVTEEVTHIIYTLKQTIRGSRQQARLTFRILS